MITAPEMAALAQTLQPTMSMLQIAENQNDLESVVAVLESQESFDLENNLARFKDREEPLPMPEEQERIKFLGYFLSKNLDWERPIRIQLDFGSRYAYIPLFLMLRAFELKGKRNVTLKQGLSLHTEGQVNAAGLAHFEFEALGDVIRYPEKTMGFLIYLIRPQGAKAQPPTEESVEAPSEPGIVRSQPGLNVYRKIDTRV